MFYEPKKNNHGLPHNPFKALVAPRPIGWISTISSGGVANIAPYSFFNAVSATPDLVMFSSAGWKDSVENISQNGEFVCNYVGEAMIEAMNVTSVDAPSDISEFDTAALKSEASALVSPPRVKGIPAALECRKTEIIELKDTSGASTDHFMVIGEVIGVHINDAYVTDGRFDVASARPVARLGYMDYQKSGEIFELYRPSWKSE